MILNYKVIPHSGDLDFRFHADSDEEAIRLVEDYFKESGETSWDLIEGIEGKDARFVKTFKIADPVLKIDRTEIVRSVFEHNLRIVGECTEKEYGDLLIRYCNHHRNDSGAYIVSHSPAFCRDDLARTPLTLSVEDLRMLLNRKFEKEND